MFSFEFSPTLFDLKFPGVFISSECTSAGKSGETRRTILVPEKCCARPRLSFTLYVENLRPAVAPKCLN
jgi:hypothetical protein